jgi:hypothetical protein
VKHARTYGSEQSIIDHYKDQQKRLEQLRAKSSLPSIVINTSEMDFREIGETIYESFVAGYIAAA